MYYENTEPLEALIAIAAILATNTIDSKSPSALMHAAVCIMFDTIYPMI